MRRKAVVGLSGVIVGLIILWKFKHRMLTEDHPKATAMSPKCNLPKQCPLDHFAFSITSGAANVVGPKICFDGEMVMSPVMNNVGPGLNIVQVNGINGIIEKFYYVNVKSGKKEAILAYLKAIKPGTIVLVATFDDVSEKLTDEMRKIFVDIGSNSIQSIKKRDNWVFAGAAGLGQKSPFEMLSVNDPKSNTYGEWPEIATIQGCFPKKI